MKKYFISIVFFIFLFPFYVLAGEYVLVKGEGIEVCEAYRNNLNSFNPQNEYVMACERNINPKFTDFRKPEWKEIDLTKNIELVKKIELFLGNYVVTHDNDKGWEDYIKSLIKYKRISADLSQLEINNNGRKENVIKYRHGYCPGGSNYGAALLVLNNGKNDIDIEKTRPLLQNPRYSKNGSLSEGWDGTMYDIFIYKNKTYFDRWRYSNLSLDGKSIEKTYKLLKVFVIEPDKNNECNTSEICRYEFRSTK